MRLSDAPGCKYSPQCLDCPLPLCAEEAIDMGLPILTDLRTVEIWRLRQKGMTVESIAEHFALSRQLVEYRLKKIEHTPQVLKIMQNQL